ncbi:MAG: rhodanese-like domain-containing protein [Actinomycetota bacterium]|nr:rhodanese-like domain-containing protein [Actinomycetota bacterium]
MNGARLNPLVFWAVLAGLILPPLLFWLALWRGPSIGPRQAEQGMTSSAADWVLVDVRSREAFEAAHIQGAVNIPYKTFSAEPNGVWRDQLKGAAAIMVVCNVGVASARAVDTLRRSGFPQAVSVVGGLDGWAQVSKGGLCLAGGTRSEPREAISMVPRQEFSLLDQLVICAVAFGLKPLYEVLALVPVVLLWKFRDADLTALRRSMIAFFLGENACAVNFVFFNDQSRLWEYLHSYGMLVAFGLICYAFMEALDSRVIRFSAPGERCALLATCGQCYKHQQVRCTLYRVFLFVPPAAAVLALMLLTAKPGFRFVHGAVFGDDVLFGHPLVPQLFEVRLCPLLAIPLFIAAWGVLLLSREKGFHCSKILLAMGLGPLAFGLMRFLIYWGYSANPLWADAWEELTEFLFVAFLLWLVLGMKQVRSLWLARFGRTPSLSSQASC